MCFQLVFVSQKPRCCGKQAVWPLTGDNSSCFKNLMADRAGSHCLINTLWLPWSNDFNLHKNHMANCHQPHCQKPAGRKNFFCFVFSAFSYFLNSPKQLYVKEIKVTQESNITFLRKTAILQSEIVAFFHCQKYSSTISD